MRKARAVLLMLFVVFSVFPSDSWVKTSDRSQNGIILSLIMTKANKTSFQVLKYLGQRSDLYMEDIIENLFYQYSEGKESELFLECLFQSIVYGTGNGSGPRERLELWMNENRAAFTLLVENLPGISNSFLKAYIVGLIPYDGIMKSKTFLITECSEILQEMKMRNGYLPPGRVKEILAFFRVVRNNWEDDFLDICLSILKNSRQIEIVSLGRQVIREVTK